MGSNPLSRVSCALFSNTFSLGNLQLRVIVTDSILLNLDFICFFLLHIILKHWAKGGVFTMSRKTGMQEIKNADVQARLKVGRKRAGLMLICPYCRSTQ